MSAFGSCVKFKQIPCEYFRARKWREARMEVCHVPQSLLRYIWLASQQQPTAERREDTGSFKKQPELKLYLLTHSDNLNFQPPDRKHNFLTLVSLCCNSTMMRENCISENQNICSKCRHRSVVHCSVSDQACSICWEGTLLLPDTSDTLEAYNDILHIR